VRLPAPVRTGGHIRVVSPASASIALVPARARRGEQALSGLGFTVSYGRHAGLISADGQTAGSARQRARDLMDAFADPSVDAVLSANAGIGSRDLLEFLDPRVLAANPKPFIGFCDNVFLNQYLFTAAGLTSLYGCSLMYHLGDGGGPFPETVDYLTRALDGSPVTCVPVGSRTGEYLNWHIPELEELPRYRGIPGGWTWLREGTATGTLLGGEITTIRDMASTFGLSLDSAVLFWHVALREEPRDDVFRQLCASVDLTRLAGMVVGPHPGIAPAQWGAQVSDMLDENLPGLSCPVVVNADVGHVSPSWTVPFGEQVTIDSAGSIKFPRTPGMAGQNTGVF
jgi:muramoyltetrapeptide carboxypeptidase